LKASSNKKRSKKNSYNPNEPPLPLNLLNNSFLFPTALPTPTPTPTPSSTTSNSKSKLLNIKPKDTTVYPNLLNPTENLNLSFLNQLNKPILPKFPIPMKRLPNQGNKNPYNLLDNSVATASLPLLQNQFNLNLAELLSKTPLNFDNKLVTAFAAAASANLNVNNTTNTTETTHLNLPTSSSTINPTVPPTLSASALQTLTHNLMFPSHPTNVMAPSLANVNINANINAKANINNPTTTIKSKSKSTTTTTTTAKSKAKSKVKTNLSTTTAAAAVAATATSAIPFTAAQLQALQKAAATTSNAAATTTTTTTKDGKEKRHKTEEEEEEIDIVSDDGFDDFR
jgi:hypothetical protein